MKTLLTLNPEQVTPQQGESYPLREAARAVVFDEQENIALLHVSAEGYYKLPGGGREEKESFEQALDRECCEEIGCHVEITKTLGQIIEYRKFCQLKQVSVCFLARATSSVGVPDFTDEEKAAGFELHWIPLKEARERIQSSQPNTLEGKEYIVPRDTAILHMID